MVSNWVSCSRSIASSRGAGAAACPSAPANAIQIAIMSAFASFARLDILVFDLAAGAGFQAGKQGPDVTFAHTKHQRLLAAVVVFVPYGQEVGAFLAQQEHRWREGQVVSGTHVLAVFKDVDALVGNLYDGRAGLEVKIPVAGDIDQPAGGLRQFDDRTTDVFDAVAPPPRSHGGRSERYDKSAESNLGHEGTRMNTN